MFEFMDENDLLYGAIRLGEDFGDTEEWGDPFEFSIRAYQNVEIDTHTE